MLEIDPGVAIKPTYLTLSVSDVLMLAPVDTDPAGTFVHNIRAYLFDHPSVYYDLGFSVTIINCKVMAFYADSPNFTGARIDLTQTITYVTFFHATESYPFSFNEFDSTGSPGCASNYI